MRSKKATVCIFLGVVLFGLSIAIMPRIGLEGDSPDFITLGLGFLMFMVGAVMTIVANKTGLNNFWLMGLSVYYPGFIIMRLGIPKVPHRLEYFLAGLFITVIGFLLCWRCQVVQEAKGVSPKKQ